MTPQKVGGILFIFDWKDSKWTYGDLTNVVNDELSVKNKEGDRVQLKFLSADEAAEMLGVFLAPRTEIINRRFRKWYKKLGTQEKR